MSLFGSKIPKHLNVSEECEMKSPKTLFVMKFVAVTTGETLAKYKKRRGVRKSCLKEGADTKNQRKKDIFFFILRGDPSVNRTQSNVWLQIYSLYCSCNSSLLQMQIISLVNIVPLCRDSNKQHRHISHLA